MYCGRHPAITALTAMFSTVASAQRGGTTAMTSPARRPEPAIIARTRSAVGNTNGRPSVSRRASARHLARQATNHLLERVFCALTDYREGLTADRMLDDGQRQIGHAQVLRLLARQPD